MKPGYKTTFFSFFCLAALLFSALGVTPAYAATLMVRSAADDGTTTPGNCPGAGCRLRDAIAAAVAGDTITFAGDYTIRLASQLTIDKDLTIDGTGRVITLSGDTTGDGVGDVRVFLVNGGVTVSLISLIITKGDQINSGIRNNGSLVVTNCSFVSNERQGIYNYNSGNLTVSNSTFANNTNPAGFQGSGIFSAGTLTVTNSTFLNNHSGGAGGAISVSSGSATLANNTFYGNQSDSIFGGGAIYSAAILNAANNTFSNNRASNLAGGIYVASSGTANLTNNIVANNTLGGNCYNNGGTITGANNLTDDDTCGAGFTNSASIRLGALGSNGGGTQTIPLLPGSAAIDAGDDAVCAAAVGAPGYGAGGEDQRGVSRPQGAHCDIGAYEYKTSHVIVVILPPTVTATDGTFLDKVNLTGTPVSGASYYLIYRSGSLDGPKIPASGYRTTSLGGDDLWTAPGVTYYYWAQACNASGCSVFSTPDPGWQGLPAPVVTASDGTPADKLSVTWTSVPGATSYLAYRSETPDGPKIPANGYPVNSPGGDDLWAAPGVTYYYWVKACNGPNCSALSAAETGWR